MLYIFQAIDSEEDDEGIGEDIDVIDLEDKKAELVRENEAIIQQLEEVLETTTSEIKATASVPDDTAAARAALAEKKGRKRRINTYIPTCVLTEEEKTHM